MTSEQVKIKLTIIIPAYNSEEYIIRALDSIPQRKDLEVIVVDDCSIDNTLNIIKEYENNLGNYLVLHQEKNQGPSMARQRGFELAQGEFVYFFDSDDWFLTNNLNAAIDLLYSDQVKTIDMLSGKHEDNDDIIGDHVFQYSINNTFIKKHLLTKDMFIPGYFNEDFYTVQKLLSTNKNVKMATIDSVLWHWNNHRENSLTDIKHKLDRDKINKVNSYEVTFEDLVNDLNKLKLSIIIPVYNRPERIIKALDSIPVRKDIETIVIDDRSTDNTFEVVKDYIERHQEKVIHLIRQEVNSGPGISRNKGLDIAKGEYVTFLDSDDWFVTKNIELVLNSYDNIKTIDVLWFDNKLSQGENWWACDRRLVLQGRLVKREIIGDTRHNGKRIGEDKDFLLEIRSKKPKEMKLNLPIYIYDYRAGGPNQEEDTLTYQYLKGNNWHW